MSGDGVSSLVNLPAWCDGRIIDVEIQNRNGYAEQDADGNWYYHLLDRIDHTDDNSDIFAGTRDVVSDDIIIWYRDANGSLSNIVNTVFIHDSKPTLAVNASVYAVNTTTVIGTTADLLSQGEEIVDEATALANPFYSFGADNDPEKAKFYITDSSGKEHEIAEETVMEIRGEHGLLSINASDGHLAYMYEADEAADHSDVFNFRITDSDGDERTSSFTVNTKFDENYVPEMTDPDDIMGADENAIPDEAENANAEETTQPDDAILLDEDEELDAGEENSAEDAESEEMDDNHKAKTQDGALPSKTGSVQTRFRLASPASVM